MKKLLLLICLISCVGLSNSYANNSYYINDSAVEEVLSSGVEVNPVFNLNTNSVLGHQEMLNEKDPLIAILLDILVGGLGIHRVYLDGRPTLILIYFITCGGIFGVVPLVDLIVLAINYDDISAYVGNDKFIMW
ncbi:TM2 domain-containing protein [Marivirga sp. S37H4]|uniref:TM2 domain-containing protein n=1 Tax=Marivirga aurantiaca TaxID=2802615 RepID=A0A934X181_9BACT|nr:TM2 domain-containing protein [Marivirga aurantiaca]MBK6266809.1 TM2 domain-containing protein [Marivirga aurantiaca]